MKYLSKLLSMFLVGAMLYSTGCTDYETDINNLEKEVDQIKQELNGQIDALKADLGADIEALEGAIEAANNAIAANQTAIDGLKAADAAMDTRVKAAEEAIIKANADIAAANAAIAENADAIEENAEAIEAAKKSIADAVAAIAEANKAIEENADAIEALKLVDEEFAKDIADLEENLATLETELKAYADELLKEGKSYTDTEVKKVNDALLAHIEAFTSYQAEVKGIIEALTARVAANEEAIKGLQANVEELYELHDIQGQLIENLDGRFELFIEYTEQELEVLRDADANLAILIAANTDYIKNVENSLIDFQKIANEQFTKAFGQIAENLSKINALDAALKAEQTERIAMGKSIHEHIANVQTELKGMIAELDSKYAAEVEAIYAKYDAIVAELEKDIEDLEAMLAQQRIDLEEQIARVDAHVDKALNHAMDAIAKLDAETDQAFEDLKKTMNDEFAKVRKELADEVKKLEGKIKDVNDALDAFKSDMKTALFQMDFMINVILNRVQSIVFVPEYSDGKGTIKYAKAGNAIVEARSQMVYQVYPAECASLIAYAPESFSYLVKDLKNPNTRADAAQFNIVDVKGDANGLLTVTFDARNLGADFYNKKMEYAAALVLTTEEANLSTAYTNVVPATPEKITMAIYDGERKLPLYPSYSNKQEFRYNETDRSEKILPNHVLMYSIGEKLYTEAELNAAGYVLTSTRTKFAERSANDTNIEPFKYELDEADIYEVSVATITYEWINKGVYFGYRYVAGGLSVAAADYCVTTPTTAKVEMTSLNATWTYSKDVEVDAALFNKKDADYKRVYTIDLKADVLSENLPKGEGHPSVLEVLKWNPELLEIEPVVKVLDGAEYKVAKDVVAEYIVTEKDEVKFAFTGYEWDKKYLVEVAYTLKKTVGRTSVPFLTATFVTNIETVDRNRKAVEVDYKPTTVDFVSNIKLIEGEISNEARDLYYTMIKDAFDAKTNYDIVEQDYLDNNLNKDKQTYTSTQDFTAYGVNENEKLTRDEVIKNNGGWVTTGLELYENLDAKERTIRTNYHYREFSFVPASIEFEKTFTTWYGQEFIVTKTVNFDFTKVNKMFDFQHNEYRVFENPYYSQVQPEYKWVGDDESSELIDTFDVAKVDLLDAFYVVAIDAEGKKTKLNYSDLAEYPVYNMAYAFEFEDKYSERIKMGDDFKISYYGSEDYVDVMGKLYVVNSNGAKYQLPTSFDKGGEYADYTVRKFNPIGELIVDDVVVDIKNSQMYEANVFDQIELWDFRSNGRDPYRIITDGAWVVGNGVDNGFEKDKTVQDIYGIYWNWYVDKTEVPADVVVEFNETTGVLTFKNTQQIALTKAFTVPVMLEIYNVWSVEYSQKPITVNVTFNPIPVQ